VAFNDLSDLSNIDEGVACVILEPVMGNVGLVRPEKEYLREVRRACDDAGAVLIFDEVITGFRVAKGGAQSLYGVTPDITTLGKILGGGFPIGAFGGKEEIMRMVAPEGRMFNAGTFNGNPVSMVAGSAVVEMLDEEVYRVLKNSTDRLCGGISDALDDAGMDFFLSKLGSAFTVFLTRGTVTDYATAKRADAGRFMKLHRGLMERGVYLPPSQFECCFMSTAHSGEDIEKTIEAFAGAASEARRGQGGADMKIRVGTRGSRLALKQVEVAFSRFAEEEYEVVVIKTEGDIDRSRPLAALSQGAFERELNDALIRGDIDLAVHSMKDVPMDLPQR
jgi:glutamate-1-semialdehyde 2,1-aminomutase